jgi:hypothetical protein
MSDSKLENDCGLIIDPALLAQIQAACRHREAEFAAAGAPLPLPPTPATLSEAECFAAAVATMPANVRRFFQAEDPAVSPRQSESAQDRLERETRASFGGWCGG